MIGLCIFTSGYAIKSPGENIRLATCYFSANTCFTKTVNLRRGTQKELPKRVLGRIVIDFDQRKVCNGKSTVFCL